MKWSPQQDAALKSVSAWIKDKSGPQVFRLFGWAGTGKSTLATHLAKDVKKVCFAAFTGKAALVMRKRGCSGASTIHSLIYKLADELGGQPRFVINPDSPVINADLVVIDEVSMVDTDLANDLLSFGKKVLVLGDPFQLPPVRGAGYFTDVEPDIMLTEIHRQAADNPIIRLSMDIREGRGLTFGRYGESKVIQRSDLDQFDVVEADTVLVGKNRTRVLYNNRLRELNGIETHLPTVGEKIICLRNNKEKRLLNGQIWIISQILSARVDGTYEFLLDPEEGSGAGTDTRIVTHIDFFTGAADERPWTWKKEFDEFTFGYALTCHKAQGSQWPNVCLFDESSTFREESSRWLYTAITRAAERITIVQ